MEKHTPLPWWRDDDGFIASGDGDTYETVADVNCNDCDIDEREANLALIVRAVNSHDALLAALTSADNWLGELWQGGASPDDGLGGLIREIRAAIAKATGQEVKP